MTISFNGHSFKYEIEGICKLFFPLMRFEFQYDAEKLPPEGDAVHTERKQEDDATRLTVWVCLNGETRQAETQLPNGGERHENECERLLCKLLFELLSDWLGVRPGWGILTGVRPVNIIQKERRAGRSDADIAGFLGNDYLVTPEKLSLAMQTADIQAPILSDLSSRSYSLYVAIPFCVSRCSYCSFVSHDIGKKMTAARVDEYVELLSRELAYTGQIAREKGLSLDSIYIGGGTPTALSAPQLQRVTEAIAANFDVASAREYTIEAGRADTIDPEKLTVIHSAGQALRQGTRISVNPQTFNDDVLRAIGRKHTADQAEAAFRMARDTGLQIINMDFIAGLPGDTLESFRATIDRAVSLRPENITVHTLTIKRSADLFQEEGIRERLQADQTAAMTAYAQKTLIAAGYRPYYLYRQKNTVGNLENVGYALPGTESRYNVFIMDEIQTILACGAGGVTKIVSDEPVGERGPIERVFNYKYHFEYIDRFDEILTRKDQAASCLK